MQANSVQLPKGDRGSTIGYPMWLLVFAVLLLTARIGGNFYQLMHPQAPSGFVDTLETPDDGRLKLFAFLSDDGTSSERMYDALQHNGELVPLVKKKFALVQVIDGYQDDKKKEALFDRYHVYELPTLVIALSDGTEVAQQRGFVSSQLVTVFLKGAISDIDFVIGKSLMDDGRYAEAAAAFERYPRRGVHPGYRSQSEMFEVACLVLSHQLDKARAVAQRVAKDEGAVGFPAEQCNYMAGQLREKQLVLDARFLTSENEFAFAVKALADGKNDSAVEHLRKVVRESYSGEPERDFALATLKRQFKIDGSEEKDR